MHRLRTTLILTACRIFQSAKALTGKRALSALLLLPGLLLLPARMAGAGDWPQILGPSRNGIAVGETLPDKLPAEGPTLLWQVDVGEGFAGPAVVGTRAVLFHRDDAGERLDAYDTRTGKLLWKTSFASTYRGTIIEDNGPRCVPVIHNDSVYVYGAAGHLHAVDLTSGKTRWNRPLAKECGAPEGYFGAGSTPIVAGENLLVNVGGRDGQGLVAVSLRDGKTTWSATSEQASYSAPVLTEIDGAGAVLFVTRLNLVAVRPEDGTELFRTPFGARGPTVNGASPLAFDGHIFLTASYGVGARWLKPGRGTVETIWDEDTILSSQYPTPVRVGKFLYGIDGRQDVGSARLRCIDPATPKVLWTAEDFGMATLIAAGNRILAMKTDGTLTLLAADPTGYRKLGEFTAFSSTVRALPALSNGQFYARDTRLLRCWKLAP